jgi:uncharacterized damage-inducible protein DinB
MARYQNEGVKMNSVIFLLQDGFKYNHWANQTLLKAINQLPDDAYHAKLNIPFHSIHGLLFHYYYYDEKYRQRLVDKVENPEFAKNMTRQELIEALFENSEVWLQWIDSSRQFSDELLLKLNNILIHNAYHRGQITIAFAMLGFELPSLDVFLYRDTIGSQ